MPEFGVVDAVKTVNDGDFLTSDLIVGTTVLPVDNTDIFETATLTGTVQINGEVHAYNAVDTTNSTITLASGLVAAASLNDPVYVYPLTPVKYAYVTLTGGEGDSLSVRVPHNLVAYASLTDGPREPGQGESVTVDDVDGELVLLDVVGAQPVFDASTATIVTATDGGERVQIDGDGITFYTNDPVQTLAFGTTSTPYALAIDPAGYVYVGGTVGQGSGNGLLRKYAPSGAEVVTGGFPISVGGIVYGVALDASGNIYAATNGTLYKYNSAGVAGITFAIPALIGGVALDAAGNIYIADRTASNVIRKYGPTGTQVVTGGFPISTTGQPLGVALDAAGNIYVADATNSSIRKFSPTGTTLATFSPALGPPHGVTLDAAGNIYVSTLSVIYKLDSAGVVDSDYPSGWATLQGQFDDVALDASGNIYVVDQNNRLVRKYNNPGTVISSAQMVTAQGRLNAFDATISGNLEVDSISSANGLQITSPVTMLQKTQAGSVSVTFPSAASVPIGVSFDVPFLTAPMVVVSPGTGNTSPIVIAEASAITTTGFTATLLTANGATATNTRVINWIAVVP